MIWNLAGAAAFVAGFVGAFVPLLPTVPFMLLAAFCFARGSQRFHDWLLAHRRFGPAIRDWREHGAIRPAGKRAAVAAILASFLLALLIGLPGHLLALQAAVLGGVTAFILTRPGGARPPEDAALSPSGGAPAPRRRSRPDPR